MGHPERSIKKILMTADAVGGVWSYSLDLCKALLAYNVEVCLAVMGGPLSAGQRLEANRIPKLDLRTGDFKLEWMDDPWEDVDAAGKWLLDIEKETGPDVIHLNGYCHAALSWSSPVIVVAHSCVLSWWQAVKREPLPLKWQQYKQGVIKGLNSADAVVSISYTYANDLKKLYGPLNNLSVIYNGRDPALFYSTTKKTQAFAMGRIWDEAKNFSVFRRISERKECPLLIAGANSYPGTDTPLEIPGVQLLGLLDQTDVRKYLAESFIYILPAKYEPFGLSVLEAALSGCLLVLADIPTLRELWQNSALYFNPDDHRDLDRCLQDVLRNPEKSSELIRRSSARARSFSLQLMAEKYYSLYRSLINKNVEIPI